MFLLSDRTNYHFSLQATWIRNSILHALKISTKLNIREINNSFVYQHPSISSLGQFVGDLTSKGVAVAQGNRVEEMLDLVARWGKNFTAHNASAPAPTKDVVVITGTTGAIGSNVLAELTRSPTVAKIYALTRKSTLSLQPSVERQKEALSNRGLDPDVVDGSRVVVVDADLTRPDLGLLEDLFEEVSEAFSPATVFDVFQRSDPQ